MARWGKFFGRRSKPDVVVALRARFESFRELLDGNNRVLALMADAGEKLGGDYLFDMQYLRWLDAELAQAVATVVRDLGRISGDRYPGLGDAFDRIRAAVRATLESRVVVAQGPLVIKVTELGGESVGLAGEKMAALGELHARLSVPIPEGFVITACAFGRVIANSPLAEQLDALRRADGDTEERGRQLVEAIIAARLPRDVDKAIQRSLREFDRQAVFAVRSSALGEDSELSFAGQYTTVLNVPRRDVPQAYLRVAASLFRPRVLAYRRKHGLPLVEGAMAVGCMRMVAAAASGVAFTLDPATPESDAVIVTATHGLGLMVVEGRGAVDRFEVSRLPPHPVLRREIAAKLEMYVPAGAGGVRRVEVPDAHREQPAISDATASQIASVTLQIERHLKRPQDVEWAVDSAGRVTVLQARPLRLSAPTPARGDELAQTLQSRRVLMRGKGAVACRGIGAGPVCVVGRGEPSGAVAPGSVLVARYASPKLSALVSSARAVITDVGATTGHLATVAREYRVPAILDTGDATVVLKPGQDVTVDAQENIVYEGVVHELLRYGLLSGDTYEDAAEFRLLRAMLKHIVPLRLSDPSSPEFTPERCLSYHDIVRFAHERAVTELSELGGVDLGRGGRHARRLDLDIPLDLVIIDIGGGLVGDRRERLVRRADVACEPLVALLSGLTAPGTWSTAPADMDLEGFMSSATRARVLTLPGAAVVEQNVAIISRQYLNLNLRLGYHFNVVDCYLTERPNQSYILFRFVGGVTDLTRRTRRARLLSEILTHYDFTVDQNGELVVGRLSGVSPQIVTERLQMVGRLIGFSRQLDILLRDEEIGSRLVESFVLGRCGEEYWHSGGSMNNQIEVMVLDDEPTVCERLQEFLTKKGMAVETFGDSQTAMDRLTKKRFDVVVTDLKMKGPTGLDVLIFVKQQSLPTQVIIITGYATIEAARGAEGVGAFEFINKPFHLKDMYSLVKKAAKKARASRRTSRSPAEEG